MKYKISWNKKDLIGEVNLPPSKSISNRLLIIKALKHSDFLIDNLSGSEDTIVLNNALNNPGPKINVGQAGTTMRFLTAFFAGRKGEWIITGTERMENRPIGELVDALNQLGANIKYLKNKGFPPIKISGRSLKAKFVEIDGRISSQFISALLLISPTLPYGLRIKLKNKIISAPYIKMTLSLMKYFGVDSVWNDDEIIVEKQFYKGKRISIEGDWSAGSYWYEMAAFADNVDLTIYGLNKESFQGDAIVAELFEPLGIKTTYLSNGIHLSKQKSILKELEFDFTNYPDIVQTLVVTLTMKNIPLKFIGTDSLRTKETDRILALKHELAKFGIILKDSPGGILEWDGEIIRKLNKVINIATYKDHRMAMAFAPVALLNRKIIIDDPYVVKKSYPEFWEDLKKAGFTIDNKNGRKIIQKKYR